MSGRISRTYSSCVRLIKLQFEVSRGTNMEKLRNITAAEVHREDTDFLLNYYKKKVRCVSTVRYTALYCISGPLLRYSYKCENC